METLPRVGTTTYVKDVSSVTGKERHTYEKASNLHPLGSVEFWVDKVTLIPVEKANTDNKWLEELGNFESIPHFVLAEFDSNKTTVNQLSSKYAMNTQYLTTTLLFGYTEENKPLTKPELWDDDAWSNQVEHVAKISLKADEGILIMGLTPGVDYTVKENLTETDYQEGYYFKEVYDSEGVHTSKQEITGEIHTNITDEVHYVNTFTEKTDLTIKKQVEGGLGNQNKNWNFTISFTPNSNFFDTKYTYEKTGDTNTTDTLTLTQENGKYTGSFTLKANETITIKDIPVGTSYEINEVEANRDSYITIVDKPSGILEDKTEVLFRNIRYEVKNISIQKNW